MPGLLGPDFAGPVFESIAFLFAPTVAVYVTLLRHNLSKARTQSSYFLHFLSPLHSATTINSNRVSQELKSF